MLVAEHVFLNRSLYREAERHFALRNSLTGLIDSAVSSISDASKTKDGESVKVSDLLNRLSALEKENSELRSTLSKLEAKVSQLEGSKPQTAPVAAVPAVKTEKKEEKDDDDFELFDEEEEEDSEEKKRITEERLKAYASKKSNSKSLTLNTFLNGIYSLS